MSGRSPFREISHQVDFCVVGGGLSGLCAAVSAARRGARVALMHERPMLGGNASSEIRMWICGAARPCHRETGLIDEIRMENLYRNTSRSWGVWDGLLYELARNEPNLTLLLNCSCNDIEMDGARIRAVRGWQLTTQSWHRVEAKLFADCSGDSVLAPLSGAEVRWGREARSEFGESLAPEEADRKTMGMSCLIQARETKRPQRFIKPEWANTYRSDDDLPHRLHDIHHWSTNFWWIELGGEGDSIHDTEAVRDELLKVAYGVWDHIKNQSDHGAENWMLDWVGFLPGKRESRRYVGDYLLTQNDISEARPFEDIAAYGGWTLDDHHPAGVCYRGEPTPWLTAPSPYSIPYRCLYSRNIENLFCAGRNISATHAGMSSTRVMATCATLGQAAGTAAALATHHKLTPRAVYREALGALQSALMEDDCWLPGRRREISALSRTARLSASEGGPESLRRGEDRPTKENPDGWKASPGAWVEYRFDKPEALGRARVIFDTRLDERFLNMPCSYPLQAEFAPLPDTLAKAFRLEAETAPGQWQTVLHARDHHQRLARVAMPLRASAVRLVVEETWGAPQARVYGFDVTPA